MDRRFCAAAARTRLDRGPQRRDRVSLGGGTQRALRRDRGRVRPAQGRCHCHAATRRQSSQQSRRHRSSRSCSRRRAIRSAPASSPVWRDRAATSPACRARSTDVAGKRLELLREVVPGLRRLAILANVDNPHVVLEMGEVQASSPHARPRSRHVRNPASRRYRARLRGAQGPRGGALCCRRPAHRHATEFASIPWRWARDCRRCTVSGNPSKREV